MIEPKEIVVKGKHLCAVCERWIPDGVKAYTWENPKGKIIHLCLVCDDFIEEGLCDDNEFLPDSVDIWDWVYQQKWAICPVCGCDDSSGWFGGHLEERGCEYIIFDCDDCNHQWEKYIGWKKLPEADHD